jgi:hypothetical protein
MSEDSTAVAPLRGPDGRLLPGAHLKGGRPKGSSQSELVRKLIEPHRAALIERALKLTESTDPFAVANGLRICLERLAPAPKQESEKVHVDGLAEATTFAGKCDAVIRAVSQGEISAEAGERVLRLLDVYRRAHETDALEARMAALEAALKAGGAPVIIDAPPAGGDLV